ncbi:beta strand repeat-containing protein, partial [Dyadobacter jejuensis]|uniref:beta strand repeat-containing protein n=1 Tax=Dyadobacter jejuensis TaxID=1082580 RepID=UPI0035B612D7
GAQTVVVPYVTIDNAGVPSVTPGSVTAGFTVAVSVSGNVFNDPDALNVNNSSGDANLVPAGMTAILVDNTTGLVTANTAVGTDGVFDFGNVSPGDYTVVLSTTAGTIGSTPPATDLPAGWLNTGEFTGTPDSGNDGSVNGSSEVFTVTATDVTNVNFGIQQPPTANVVVIPTVPNPGGTIATDFTSSFGGDDPTTNGIVASLKITEFPTNATSISIDGVLYSDLTSIETAYPNGIPTDASGVPTVPILVDPTDGAQTVVVPYVTIDNAGVASVTPGSVTAGFTVAVSVSGNVFNDPDALNVNNSSGDANLVPAGMTAILVDNTTGLVTANTSVGTDGVFDFGNVSPGDYTVVLSTTAGTIGSTPPATDLPAGWLNTGEFTGTPDSGNDGSVNGSSEVFTVTATDVTNVNFGIQQPPTANVVVIPTVPNPGGTIATDFTSSFGGDDPTTNGIVASLKITEFPTNATSISIDGVLYSDLTSIETAYPNGIPTDASGVPTVPILVDPTDGAQTVVVPYVTIDNAGVASVTPGSVTAGFTVA